MLKLAAAKFDSRPTFEKIIDFSTLYSNITGACDYNKTHWATELDRGCALIILILYIVVSKWSSSIFILDKASKDLLWPTQWHLLRGEKKKKHQANKNKNKYKTKQNQKRLNRKPASH